MKNKTFFKTPKGNQNEWYHYLSGTILIIVLTSLFSVPALITLSQSIDYQNYLILISTSALICLSIFLTLKWVHGRSASTLINANKIRWNRIFWAGGFFLGMSIIIEFCNWLINPSIYQFSYDATAFFKYLIISLVFIPFQAAGEEMLLRGYYLQGLAWKTKSPWIAILITSIIFGLLHLSNPEISAFGPFFLFGYIFMGIIAGIITVMDDGSELAIGLHISNNLYSAIIVSFSESALQTNTLFYINHYNPTFWTIISIGSFLIFLAICNRKFKWDSYKILLDKIENNS